MEGGADPLGSSGKMRNMLIDDTSRRVQDSQELENTPSRLRFNFLN